MSTTANTSSASSASSAATAAPPASPLFFTPLHALHLELGARMVPFAGYSMPVQYPAGLLAEHHHTRRAAGLFDVSHMGQLRLVGADAAAAFESLMPMDVIDLPVGKQRYGLLLNGEGNILDDLMFIRRQSDIESDIDSDIESDIFVVVNGACKQADLAHMQSHIGSRCQIIPLPELALLALQGPLAVAALARLAPDVAKLRFMTGGAFKLHTGQHRIPVFLTRSGYTGEDGFEISVHSSQAEALARALLAQPEVQPIGLGARNSLRLEAGLCLYGNDIDRNTNPVEANLLWAMQKVRRTGGTRAGGFPGAARLLAQMEAPMEAPIEAPMEAPTAPAKRRVGLVALERIPVREHTPLHHPLNGQPVGMVTSGLLGPTVDRPIAMGYVPAALAAVGTRLNAMVRGKPVPMEVAPMPFTPHRYWRG